MVDFEQLDQALGYEYNPDLWADSAKIDVGDMLVELEDQGWALLSEALPNRSLRWQVQLAEALMLTEDPRAFDVLVQLVRSAEPGVGLAAAETLLNKRYEWSPEVSIRTDLERHRARLQGRDQALIDRLLTRLPY